MSKPVAGFEKLTAYDLLNFAIGRGPEPVKHVSTVSEPSGALPGSNIMQG
jgi:hypothetical protein